VDGVETGTADASAVGDIDSGISPVVVGRFTNDYNQCYNGLMDEVAIHTKALTAAEILEHYEARKAMFIDIVEGPAGQGKALEFDGADDHVLVTDPSLGLTYAITLEAWVCWDGTLGYKPFVSMPAGDTISIQVSGKGIALADGKLGFGSSNGQRSIGADNAIASNTWNHLAATSDGQVFKLYINSELVKTVDHGSMLLLTSTNNHLVIGREFHYGYPDRVFPGTLDEVRISDVARTPEEIRQSYKSGISFYGGAAKLADNEIIPDGNTSGLWHFDEGSGRALGDSSGNGNDGVINGATWTRGLRGNALEFDGLDDYVDCGAHSSLQITGDVTLECWAKYDSLGEQNNLIVQGKGNVDGNSSSNILYSFSIHSDNTLKATWEYGNGDNVPLFSTEAADIGSGEWHHYSMVRDTSNMQVTFYIDGVQLGEVKSYSNGPEDGSSTPLQIGGAWDYFTNDGPRNLFNGIIDEVAIINRTLSPLEIRSHANRYHYKTTLLSNTITIPNNHTLDTLHFNRNVPQNTYLNISIHNAVTDDILYHEYNDSAEGTIDLSVLDLSDQPAIYLAAYLQSNATKTPALNDWSLNWTEKVEQPDIAPPELIGNVPSDILVTEDTPEENITDLADHFNDIYSAVQPPTYALQQVSDKVNMTLALDGTRLDVVHLAENWTGTVRVVANCTNMYGLCTPTNMFNITVTGVNDAPVVELLTPSDGGVIPATEAVLRWSAFDADDAVDDLVFDLYFGNSSNTTLLRENVTGSTTTVTNLSDGGTYHWYVLARDGELTGPCLNGTWRFTADLDVSVPEVDLRSPADEAAVNSTSVNLSWIAINITENVVYHVYMGGSAGNLTEKGTTGNTWYEITGLADNETYYWKVVPVAGGLEGRCRSGTWSFTVRKGFIPVYNITAELDDSTLTIEHGKGGNFILSLTNNGNIPTVVEIVPKGVIIGLLDIDDAILLPVGKTRVVAGTIGNTFSLTPDVYTLTLDLVIPVQTLTLSFFVNVTEKEKPADDDDVTPGDDDDDGDGNETGKGDDWIFTMKIVGLQLWIWMTIVACVVILFIVRFLVIRRRDAAYEDDEDYDEEDDEDYDEDEEEDEEWVDEGGPLGPVMDEPSGPGVDKSGPGKETSGELPPPLDVKTESGGAGEAAPAETEEISPSIKTIIPGYTLTGKLGTGGFATVYKAIGPEGKKYAIKLPKFMDSTIDTSVLDKFREESDIWKKLKHKNIVTFYEGDVRPIPYMVIEYMKGGNLFDRLRGGIPPTNEGISLIMEILSGMSYAHRMASVHRDIKPENILFSVDGRPKISDWGIGKFMASESVSKTVGGKGTLAYSSPEQISPEKFGEIDWATDVFQLGIVFYEILTGNNPFMADDPVTIMSRLVSHTPAAPSSLVPEIPPEVDAIILRSLEKEKVKRFSSADSMFEKLKEAFKERQKNLEHYGEMLEAALADGTISDDEDVMLKGMRKRYGISDAEHERMVAETSEVETWGSE